MACKAVKFQNNYLCLQDAAVSAEVASTVRRLFNDQFRLYLDGRQSRQATKQAVANMLIDEEPSLLDDFMEVCISPSHIWYPCGGITMSLSFSGELRPIEVMSEHKTAYCVNIDTLVPFWCSRMRVFATLLVSTSVVLTDKSSHQ
jgi:hypothetical protein